nr:hypothetical protein [Tanacetum cinerariifolium]
FGKGFNQSSIVMIFRMWAAPVSSYFKRCVSAGIGSSLTSCLDGEAGFCLEELEGASPELEVFQAKDF